MMKKSNPVFCFAIIIETNVALNDRSADRKIARVENWTLPFTKN